MSGTPGGGSPVTQEAADRWQPAEVDPSCQHHGAGCVAKVTTGPSWALIGRRLDRRDIAAPVSGCTEKESSSSGGGSASSDGEDQSSSFREGWSSERHPEMFSPPRPPAESAASPLCV